MNVLDIKKQIRDLTGSDYTQTVVGNRLIRYINDVRRELYKKHDWTFLRKRYQVNLPTDEDTGTVSINQDSRTVTGVGTAFTSDMEGRYIHFSHDSNSKEEWYKIATVNSSTELILEASFVDDSISGEDYLIRKIFHRVPGDVRKLDHVSEFVSPYLLEEIGSKRMLFNYSDLYNRTGTKDYYEIAGTYGKEDEYSTGTVSGSQYSKELTGSGTAWLANIIPGDKIVINGDSYHVDKVNSDTSITLYQGLTAVKSDVAYTATTNPDSWVIRFEAQADGREIIPIEYYIQAYPFLTDEDSDYFVRIHPELIIEGVLVWEKRGHDDATWQTDYTKWINSIRETVGHTAKDNIWAPNFFRYEP
jgi:hypothetical protein